MADTAALSIAETIRQSLARLTPTERRPALALLANYPVPGLEPVAQFARRSGVSRAKLWRMVSAMESAAVSAMTCSDRGKAPNQDYRFD